MAAGMQGRPTLVVTGATGPLGSELVMAAQHRGFTTVAISRDVTRPGELRGDIAYYSWADIDEAIVPGACIFHLAARNNNAGGTAQMFDADNVDLTANLASAAERNRAEALIFTSTIRAEKPRAQDHYGQSKRAAEHILLAESALPITIVRLPALHKGRFAGRLGFLDRLPRAFQPLQLVSALRPELRMEDAALRLLDLASSPQEHSGQIVFWADNKDANPWYRFCRRFMDIAVALAVILGLFWLIAGLWLAVRLNSRGPGFFVQERVGQHGRVFRCYKFRTMAAETPNVASHFVSRASLTRLGAYLRKTKLDELPQAINLLRNEMSLVGPRPCLPVQEDLVKAREAAGILALTPGITGWAQINDIDMSDVSRLVRYDSYYRDRRSLLFDFKILFFTVMGRGRADRTAI